MAIEEKVILEVDALGEESINSLREKVKNLKSELNQTTIATTEWDEKSAALANVQDKLNKVLIISKNSAQAVGGSFNDLNQQLAVLKAAWKAAGTEIERAQLREQINAVKSQLNEMNESIGNFQHNVGNYANAMKEVFGGAIGTSIDGISKFNNTLKMLWANPIFALIAGLAAIIMGIVKAIKSSEEQTNRLNVVLAPLRRGMDGVLHLFQQVAGGILTLFEDAARGFDWVMEKLGKYFPALKQINEESRAAIELEREKQSIVKDSREQELTNARDELAIARLRTQAKDKEKYSTAERLKFVREANELERRMAERNVQLETRRLEALREEASWAENNAEVNERLVQQQAAVYRAQMAYHNKSRELLEQENTLLAEIAANSERVTKTLNSEIEKSQKEWIGKVDGQVKAARETFKEEFDEWLEQSKEDWDTELEILENSLQAEASAYLEQERLKDEQVQKDKARAQARKALLMDSLQATSSILGSIADLYENSGEADAKAQTKAKNLRIAGATIDMLGGVVSAWASAMSPTNSALTIWGQLAMGALSSATIISAGVANIAKIKNTDTSGNSAPASPIGASVSAPAIIQQIPITRTLTGASEEERLNQIATNTGKDQRVVLVYSDVEAAGRRVQVQQDESSF